MVMPNDLGAIVAYLFPTADPRKDYEVRNDGSAPFIARWDTIKLGEPPTELQINNARASMEAARVAKVDRARQAIIFLRNFDHATATAAQVRTAVGALIVVVRSLMREDLE